MLTVYQESVGALHLVLRSDGSIYLGLPDADRVLDIHREGVRLGSTAVICEALAEALGRVAAKVRAGAAARFEEEKPPPQGHHAPPAEESEGA
jgi:hypothetical protein